MRPIVLALLAILLAPALAQALVVPTSPPFALFVWTDEPVYAHDNVTFWSRSSDDLAVLLYTWDIPNEDERVGLDNWTTHAFPRRGEYDVTHAVLDATGNWGSVTRRVSIANTPPVVDFQIPSPVYRGATIELAGSGTDADGDAIVSWSWEFDDGSTALGPNVTRTFTTLGVHSVTLTAVDEGGATVVRSRLLRVLNTPPQAAAQFTPQAPIAGELVRFDAVGIDPDGPTELLTFRWDFSDGVVAESAHVDRVFGAGNHTAMVRAKDVDGGLSSPLLFLVRVDPASPP